MESPALVVYYVMHGQLDPTTPSVSPPFGSEGEAWAYHAEYGGTLWRFAVPVGAGEIVAEPNA